MAVPSTQSISLSWRPEVRFYEKRFEILRDLEEREQMWAFRAHDDRIEARLFDLWHQVTLEPTAAALHLLSRTCDDERAWTAFMTVMSQIAPKWPQSLGASFQFVEELPLDFEEALRRSRGTVLGTFDSGAFELGDWSVLWDLALPSWAKAKGQAEFGIVAAAEVPKRLARVVGRGRTAMPPTVQPDMWKEEDFPPVALFLDVVLMADAGHKDGAVAELRSFWEGARGEAATLVAGLKAKLLMDDNMREVAS